ncbi:hypothetical protein IHE45_04G035200 [Dioscorea alata]|uniref:Uncharacterized protein n=1 Tax=Dioscorea alata TaxID=55571 RepID=A0ACB7WBR0_DIOAL|nr:hypothetical protein IHE45_04G035200 [Dioscorea alata]
MNAQLVREQSIYNIANVPNLEARQEMASASKILMFIIVITAFLATAYTGTQGWIQIHAYRRSLEARRPYSPPPPPPSPGPITGP